MTVPTLFSIGLAITLPPVAASYQTTVAPAGAVAVAVRVWIGDCSHSVMFEADTVGAAGAGLIVRVTAVLASEEQDPPVACA